MNHAEFLETTFTEDLYLFPQPTTVVISSSWKSLSEQEIDLLAKILQSVKLSLGAVKIVETEKLNLAEWTEKPKRLIGFGVTITGVNYYELIDTPNTQLVLADSLAVLIKQDDLKKKLWITLKQLFFA